MAGRILGADDEVAPIPDVEGLPREAARSTPRVRPSTTCCSASAPSDPRPPRRRRSALLAVSRDGDRIVGAAIPTAPYNLGCQRSTDLDAIDRSCGTWTLRPGRCPGPGPGRAASAFVRAWCEGGSRNRDADDVEPDLPCGEGDGPERRRRASARPSTPIRLMTRWLDAVHDGGGCRGRVTTPPERARRRRADRRRWRVWEDEDVPYRSRSSAVITDGSAGASRHNRNGELRQRHARCGSSDDGRAPRSIRYVLRLPNAPPSVRVGSARSSLSRRSEVAAPSGTPPS